MDLGQFIGVTRVFHLMRRPGKGGEVHVVSFKEQSASAFVGNLCPADSDFISGFLGYNIAGHVIGYLISVNAEFSASAPVCVGFGGSHAVPF